MASPTFRQEHGQNLFSLQPCPVGLILIALLALKILDTMEDADLGI